MQVFGHALDEREAVEAEGHVAFVRMMAIPAATQAGKAAKVRALFAHLMPADWRGPGERLDMHVDMARQLLAEFGGLTEGEAQAL